MITGTDERRTNPGSTPGVEKLFVTIHGLDVVYVQQEGLIAPQ